MGHLGTRLATLSPAPENPKNGTGLARAMLPPTGNRF